MKIDNKDLMMLGALYMDARKRLIELSNAMSISITAVKSRISNLIRHRIVTGFYINVDFSKLGYGVHALSYVK